MKHLKELKLNEDGGGIDFLHDNPLPRLPHSEENPKRKMIDPYFEGARTKIQELAKYFEMDEKQFAMIIWNGANDNNISEKSMEMIGSMVYTFGLI